MLRGTEPIRLSVILASHNSRATISRCLDALEPQIGDGIEVLVSDSSTDETADFVATRYPWVQLLRSKERLFPGESRNRAIAQARGEILAFVDADCIPGADWIRQSIEAQQQWGPVVGGSVDNANPEDRAGWIYYFCEFATWMPGQDAKWMDEIPTCCLTVDRSVMERTGRFRSEGYSSDTAFHWRLADQGIRSRFEPQLRVAHINPARFSRIVSKMRMHGEHFALTRCEERRIGRAHALMLWVGSPALPIVLLWRRTRQIMRAGHYRSELVRSLPGLFAALTAWSFGEWRGYGNHLWNSTKHG